MEGRKGDPGATEKSRRMAHTSDVRYHELLFFNISTRSYIGKFL